MRRTLKTLIASLQSCNGRFVYDGDAYGFATSLLADCVHPIPLTKTRAVSPLPSAAFASKASTCGKSSTGRAAIVPRGLGHQPTESIVKSRNFLLAFLITMCVLAAALVVMTMQSGCTATAQTSASNDLNGAAANLMKASTFLVGSPTTAPSPVVTTAETIVPATTPWITTAGLALTSLASLLGIGATLVKSQQVTNLRNALVAVGSDVKEFAQPGVSFPAQVEKTISDVLGTAFAAPAQTSTAPTVT